MATPYPCGYCNGKIHDAPVSIEAICWRCWWEQYGQRLAVRQWKRRRWWRMLVP
jgi:hypothetical protein